ncbi:FGGY family carbohydrate kinase [Martelella alba]|uniref:ATP:glycerol 3-phosphotransferase n=1 Tax=Martelella alba TaxID=2590451 RepID=A0ABY2SIX7_9HYPH|nr:FGGY-family carbohydrate kinase [Martelella alba]TKI05208.1 carbohydrate kinase [Martelella alba]
MLAAKDIIIALDEGTTNAKAVALDSQGNVIAKFSQPLSIQTPREGWVEQSGDLLFEASRTVIAQAVAHVGAQNITAIAISNQRETAIGWFRGSGEPLHPALTWQCSRTADFCARLRRDNLEARIKSVTGLPVAPLFSGSKMRWLLDATPDGLALAERGEICLGTIDSWILWKLTGGKAFFCDYANAARTQLLNIHSGCWDAEMLAIFGIPLAALPEIRPSSGLFGYTQGLHGIPDGIPIMAMVGDSHAALFGHALGELGCVKATYGTGSSVMAPVKSVQCDIQALATTIAWHDGQQRVYGLEGNIPHTGDAVAWMADCTGLNDWSEEKRIHALNTLPASVDSTLGVYFVPALTGLGAPWWNEHARGLVCGLSRGVTRAHLIRAAMESIAYQIADVVVAMRQHRDFNLSALMVDGGPTRNDWLMQFQADLLGCPVMRSDVPELSAIGAALLARKAMEAMSLTEMEAFIPVHTAFHPDMARHGELQEHWHGWRQAIERTLWKTQPILTEV